MCPKAKPDTVQVVRVELQERERDLAEGFLLGNVTSNLMSGAGAIISGVGVAIGGILAPFSGAITALAAVWVADRTMDEILDYASESGKKLKEKAEARFANEHGEGYTAIAAWLSSMWSYGGWSYIRTHTAKLRAQYPAPNYGLTDAEFMTDNITLHVDMPDGTTETIGPMPKFLFVQLMKFLHMYWGYTSGGTFYGPASSDPESKYFTDKITQDFNGSIVEAWETFYPFSKFGGDYYWFEHGGFPTGMAPTANDPYRGRQTWGWTKAQNIRI